MSTEHSFDFSYAFNTPQRLEFQGHSVVSFNGDNPSRTELTYTLHSPAIPCRDIIFIGFNPGTAGVPFIGKTPDAQGTTKLSDPTVRRVLSMLGSDLGDFRTDTPRHPRVTFCNLFAFAKPSLNRGHSDVLDPVPARIGLEKRLNEFPNALIICGWGMKTSWASKGFGDAMAQQIDAITPLLSERPCYRARPVNPVITDAPHDARSWSPLARLSENQRTFAHLERYRPKSTD
ncbi:hypothetical protein [Actinomyces vulturis]|uniref:hypothetical protein n=1 Tax=Actinomyces vulturis TaxID=1857645 RepID=UPI0008364EF0|nr:hypothetical protein [Actinomyces vulturis]